jgi:hypothetical protein
MASIATLPLHRVHSMHHISRQQASPARKKPFQPVQIQCCTDRQPHPQPTTPTLRAGWWARSRKPELLDLASTSRYAQYTMYLPLHRPTLSSLRPPTRRSTTKRRSGTKPLCLGYARASSQGGRSACTFPRRTGRNCSRWAPLLHTPSSSAGPCTCERLPPHLWSRPMGGC